MVAHYPISPPTITAVPPPPPNNNEHPKKNTGNLIVRIKPTKPIVTPTPPTSSTLTKTYNDKESWTIAETTIYLKQKDRHDDSEEPQSLDNQHKNLDVEEDKRKKGKDVAMDDVAEEKGDQSMGENVGYYHEEK
ncbi:hypothetical protein Tco_1080027 [Tanacetum coccineum]|uniref:Uncharacterized protein n=1 Tax=Tanacetum coccineum TaxID=301880 RepID=A0ABQ5HV79_9ASTR